jgi:hypothetical protein
MSTHELCCSTYFNDLGVVFNMNSMEVDDRSGDRSQYIIERWKFTKRNFIFNIITNPRQEKRGYPMWGIPTIRLRRRVCFNCVGVNHILPK